MTSPNLSHINALILALPPGSDRPPITRNPQRSFQMHRHIHYHGTPESFYAGTDAQQQFDFDFIQSCDMEEWHPYLNWDFQTRWSFRNRGRWMPEVTQRAELAREVALKGSLEVVVQGVQRVKKWSELICLDCDKEKWRRCTCDEM